MDPNRYYDRLNTNRDEENLIIIKNATFAWAKPGERKRPPPKSRKNKGKSKKKLSKTSIQRRDSSSSSEAALSEGLAASQAPFMLKDISLEIGREDFIGITGSVGSGKTSLLHAIIGDMVKKNGSIQVPENLDSTYECVFFYCFCAYGFLLFRSTYLYYVEGMISGRQTMLMKVTSDLFAIGTVR